METDELPPAKHEQGVKALAGHLGNTVDSALWIAALLIFLGFTLYALGVGH